MASTSTRSVQIQELLARASDIEDAAEALQRDGAGKAEIKHVQDLYGTWYAQAQHLVDSENKARFINMYEGGIWKSRIRAYLNAPSAVSALYNADQPNALLPRWNHPFRATFGENFTAQCQLLRETLHASGGTARLLGELADTFRRLPEYLDTFRRAGNPHVPSPVIEREGDLQTVVHAILRLSYNDVRPEDSVPQHAGAASRVDFLLKQSGVIIETKMTRPGLTDRKLGEELAIDWTRYPRHPDCRAIIALVYDPGRYLANPASLETDLSQDAGSPATRVVVIR